MKESEMEKRKWEEMKRVEREDRPSNTSDGREVRGLKPRSMEEGMKWEIEDEVMEEEREIREITKVVESIESPRFNWNKFVGLKTPKRWKGVKEEMNGGESEKREEGFEICEIGENIIP